MHFRGEISAIGNSPALSEGERANASVRSELCEDYEVGLATGLGDFGCSSG